MNKAAQSEPRPFNAQCALQQRSIAIVDDDPQISQALGQWVELHDLHALSFACAENLLTALQKDPPQLTVGPTANEANSCTLVGAILDLNLPGLSGLALAHLLRNLCADLPLVIVTALRNDERQRYGQLPPGVACLQKPFDLDALENALFPILH